MTNFVFIFILLLSSIFQVLLSSSSFQNKYENEITKRKTTPSFRGEYVHLPLNYTEKYKERIQIHTKNRIVVSQFINENLLAKVEKLIEIERPTYYQQQPGTLIGSLDHSIKLSNKHPSLYRSKLVGSLLKTVERVHQFMESFFNKSLVIESVTTLVRTLNNSVSYHDRFRSYNKSAPLVWCHGPHSDQCALSYGSRISCRSTTKLYRQYTAILYLHEATSGGGDLVFIDVPAPFQPALSDSPYYVSGNSSDSFYLKLKQDILYDVNDTRSWSQFKNSEKSHENRNTGDLINSSPLLQHGTFTTVRPQRGTLVAFSSGLENIHAVTQMRREERRWTVTVWFTRVDEALPLHLRPKLI